MGKRDRRGKGQRARSQKSWSEIPKENERFESYYKAQNIIPEEEWDDFMKYNRESLPVTFRITGTTRHAVAVREALENDYVHALKDIEWENEKIEPPRPLDFYPEKLAWQFNIGKTVLRKSRPFSRFHRFLVVETDVGNISRQEAVSMIPPLLLDVEPHHAVIDLCAAPGSKTAQLIESLHAVPNPTGIVIANDSDYRRSHMLIHQVKRLNSPNLVVTNHDAQLYPRIKMSQNPETFLRFDRVLCDVPCSGDGTLRKNMNVWRDWGVGNALGLHPLQVNILNRGLQLLKPGGRLVYSTCSLNPIENEAVVAEALRQWGTHVRLVPSVDRLPDLRSRPGLTTWKVMAKDREWKTKDDITGPSVTGQQAITSSLFPPTQEENEKFHLENCMRIYSHLQDTGGFFIAVIEKLSDKPNSKKRAAAESVDQDSSNKKSKSETGALETSSSSNSNNTKKDKLPRDANEEPFTFVDPENEVLNACYSFYKISPEFSRNNLLVRNATGEPIRTIYYVNPVVRPVLEFNEAKMRFVHAGIKMFALQKTDGPCNWRVQSEGVLQLYPYVDPEERVVECSKETLKSLCIETFPKLTDVPQQDFKDHLIRISEGCTFLKVDDLGPDSVFPLWRGKGSVNLMLPKRDVEELLHRVYKIENVKEDGKWRDGGKNQNPSTTLETSEKDSETPENTLQAEDETANEDENK